MTPLTVATPIARLRQARGHVGSSPTVPIDGAVCRLTGARSTSSSPPSGRSFSDCTSYTFDLQAYDVVADMAFTVGLEHTSASVDGDPGSYTLRATQVYRREGGEWKVAHRHADTDPAAG